MTIPAQTTTTAMAAATDARGGIGGCVCAPVSPAFVGAVGATLQQRLQTRPVLDAVVHPALEHPRCPTWG